MERYKECLKCKMSLVRSAGLNPIRGEKCQECMVTHLTSRRSNRDVAAVYVALPAKAYVILERCARRHAVPVDVCDLCIPY